MKLELFAKPIVHHHAIGTNMPSELVAEFDKTQKRIGDVVDVLQGKFFAMPQHLHYAFYFQMPSDVLTEILCYTRLRVSRDQLNNVEDEGIMSGSVEDYFHAVMTFCRKGSDLDLRKFFNTLCSTFELEGITLPFAKIDLGDKTFAVKPLM